MTVKTKEKRKTVKKTAKKRIEPAKPADLVEVRRLDGVTYNRVTGVICPACKMRSKDMPGGSVRNTLPWADGIRIRYHVCRRCGISFKSVETE